MNDIWKHVRNTIENKYIPISMILELTRRCNLNCCHCYNIKSNSELSFPQIKEISRQLRDAGCLFLFLTGGEVFCMPDFLEIITYLRRAGFDLKIFTNGTLITSDLVYKLGDLGISEIGISIQGAEPKTHDRISGVPGAFEKSITAIKMLKERGVPVNIKCTLMKENFAEYKDIIKLAENLGVTYVIDPVVSPRDDGSRDVLSCRLDETQLKQFYSEQFSRLEVTKVEENSICEAGRTFGSISAVGDVYPCIQIPLKVGNVFEREFLDIWSDAQMLKKMRSFKSSEIKACVDCDMVSSCSICPGLAYLEDGDLFGPASIACLNARIQKEVENEK
ncbi:MAG: radical SAM protein [PVC group bacterium]|nr:radical SAM protein [PVC group bacterium]